MIVYHELSTKSLDSALKKGLKKTSRGALGQDEAIIKTDRFLDEYRPKQLIKAGVSRDNNIYAFYGDKDYIVDIANGQVLPVESYGLQSNHALLSVDIDPHFCYVSDLDLFDQIKADMSTRAKNLRDLL